MIDKTIKTMKPTRNIPSGFLHSLCRAPCSAIARLFHSRRPAAVIGRIWAVVVNSIDRMILRRPFAHVSQKVFKRVDPPVTYDNTATPVSRICREIGVVAARTFRPRSYTPPYSSSRASFSRFGLYPISNRNIPRSAPSSSSIPGRSRLSRIDTNRSNTHLPYAPRTIVPPQNLPSPEDSPGEINRLSRHRLPLKTQVQVPLHNWTSHRANLAR